MPLPLPTLDRLTYDELVAEARGSLPALAPDWTDYNAHDPGITLLELLAWLAEGASYRLDNIPNESYRAFLRLAGVVLRPAQVAETMLVFRTTAAAQLLPNGISVRSNGGEVEFQTTAQLFVSDARLKTVMRSAGGVYEDLTARSMAKAGIVPLGQQPQPGDALYLGFDRPLAPADTEITLGLWTGNECEDHVTRGRLVAEQTAIDDEAARLCPRGLPPNQPDWRQHYSARTVWEYYAGQGRWPALKDVVDETRALTLTGVVRFKVPAFDQQATGGVPLSAAAGTYFIRCRLERGGYDCPPRIVYAAINTVAARQAVDAPMHKFRSTGRAGQRFDLAHKPVAPGSVGLTVTLKNGTADGNWQAAPSWDGLGPHTRTCVVDTEAGAVLFGDGRIGRVPAAEAEVSVAYQTGGGSDGNVAAGTLAYPTAPHPTVQIEQPFAACGGADAETLEGAKARAVRELAVPTRAVTLSDFESLALAAPGVPIVRAHAIADYHPAIGCIPVGGSTTVVVLPSCPDERPEPTAPLLATVQRYLERRRLLAGEIHVVGPQYTPVAVSARLQARPGVDRRALVGEARRALDQWFHPLTGGPDGQGWPIGRAVYRAELLALLHDVPGVAYVEEVAWRVDGQAASRCGNIALCRHGLVASGMHEITVNEGSGCHE